MKKKEKKKHINATLEFPQASQGLVRHHQDLNGSLTVLFSNEKRNVSYRNKIQSMFVEGANGTRLAHTFVDLDAAASESLRELSRDRRKVL